MSFIPSWRRGWVCHDQRRQARFDRLYAEHMQALMQGKRSKTVDCYARAMRRIAGYFDHCPVHLSISELKGYFTTALEN